MHGGLKYPHANLSLRSPFHSHSRDFFWEYFFHMSHTLLEKKERMRIVVRELKKLFPDTRTSLHYQTIWQLLVAVVLSARCTDKKVNEVTQVLFKKYTTLESIARTHVSDFEKDIRHIGLYRGKAKNIVAAAKIITQKYGGRVPDTLDELIELPGVGRKTANVVLSEGFNKATGIAVDTHVTRLAKKFGLTTQTTPDTIENDLMEILPKKEWRHFTTRMIDYGRTYSSARVKGYTDPISEVLYKKKLLP